MKKRAVIGTLIVLIALAVIGFLIYMVFYHEPNADAEESENEVVALTPYGQSLTGLAAEEQWNNGRNQIQICGGDRMEEDSCHNVTAEQWNITWDNILNSDAAYLQDPGFDVTADNFQQCFYDLLVAPTRLRFFSTDGQWTKCDSPEIRVKFADAFQDVSLTECSKEEYNALAGTEYNTQFDFDSVVGGVGILCYHDYSCITFVRYRMQTDSYTTDYFYADENIHDKVMTAYEQVLPYSMEATDETE